jgi:GrpB-like predicted nucleotidyltransferase (UPF0157 family)
VSPTDPPAPLGLEAGVVRLVASDPAWPALFAAEAARLRGALAGAPGSAADGPLPIALEHIGSTAVPGLAAKPVLDLLAGYPGGAPVAPYVRALEAAGYVHRGEQGIPGREFFRRGTPRAYHLHLAVMGGAFWREHLAFRDALRDDPVLRDAYAALKWALARRHPRDREAYTEGKTAFVRRAVAAALPPAGG